MNRFVALAFLLAACEPSTYSDLDRPTLAVVTVERGGFCSSVHAVDSAGVVWAAGSCGEESGSLMRRTQTVGADERATLDARMDEVLALGDDPECDLPSSTGRRFRFVRTLAGGGEDDVRICEPGVPLVAVQLADRLESLVSPAGVDAGTDAGAVDDAGP
ncbi:MAG: hypothetical protein H6719_01515 [Sandaracinaceae bacterium]|nr:hypothetical protein [Sandaracinaceae bacterium]